jgi:PAS domain S-box-containing protein
MSPSADPHRESTVTPPSAAGVTLRTVLGGVAGGTLLAFAVVLAFGALSVRSALRRVADEDQRQRVERTRLLLAQQGETRAATIREYAWWTETWRFIDAPHTPQSAAFLKDNFLDWVPPHYGDRLIAFWSLDRRRALVWNDSSARQAVAVFERPEAFAFIDSAKSAGGLIATPDGLFLAAFSVVVQTADQTGTGPWHGYVALARPVNQALLDEWSAALQEDLALRPFTPTDAAVGGPVSRRFAGGDSVETRVVVTGLFGQPVAVATLTSSRAFFASLSWWVFAMLAAAAVAGLGVVALVWRLGHRWLVRPLVLMAESLDRMRLEGRMSPLRAPAEVREWGVFAQGFNETLGALHESEERYQSLFRQAADAQFVLEGPGHAIVDANPAAERLVGLSREQLAGRALGDLLVPEPAAAGVRPAARVRRGDGLGVRVEVAMGAPLTGEGKLVIASVLDLTDREALEARQRQSQKMEVLGRLAGGIAHAFNNLMGGVLLSASSLRIELEREHPGQDSVRTIERSAQRAAELTKQLLSFARRDGFEREPVDIAEVVAGVVRLCARIFGPEVRVVAQPQAGQATVIGDEGQLEQALLNLCLNARDAMPGGGTITVRTDVEVVTAAGSTAQHGLEAGRYVVIAVTDSGVGMSREVQSHLFEPFYTTKARGKGTGLGLATSYGTVKAHGGGIRVDSTEGAGSRFEILLPIAEGAAGAVSPAPTPAPGRAVGAETILVVDDDPQLREAVCRSLARLGYTAVEAAGGQAGIECFRQRPDAFNLVLLDLLMPDVGGLEVFRSVRAIRPDARVLVFTVSARDDDVAHLLAGGAVGVLAKPVGLGDLAAAVRRALDAAVPPPGVR